MQHHRLIKATVLGRGTAKPRIRITTGASIHPSLPFREATLPYALGHELETQVLAWLAEQGVTVTGRAQFVTKSEHQFFFMF
jgi:hypothetical protein